MNVLQFPRLKRHGQRMALPKVPRPDVALVMTKPEVRDRLYLIADILHERASAGRILDVRELSLLAACINALTSQLYNRSPVSRAPRKRAHVTPKLAAEVKAFWCDNPTMGFDEIGLHFNLDGARVSEIVAGKRGSHQ